MVSLDTFRQSLAAAMPGLELRVNEPMYKHTTFRVGGPVTLMALPKSVEELAQVLDLASKAGVEPFFLGRGSNLLVADQGAEAFLVKLAGGLDRLELAGPNSLYVGAGVTLAQAASFALEHALTGLEFAHGIPGTLGGGVFMNAGAYDGELSQVISWADVLDEAGRAFRLAGSDLELGYRTSVFSRKPWVVTGAQLDLTAGDRTSIRARMDELSRRRRSKQPLDLPSAGSTFKRPAGHFAGALIQEAGMKGARIGGAQVSEKHAGFVVNTGGATSDDILSLIRLVRDTVLEKTGVLLEPEVRMLGCKL